MKYRIAGMAVILLAGAVCGQEDVSFDGLQIKTVSSPAVEPVPAVVAETVVEADRAPADSTEKPFESDGSQIETVAVKSDTPAGAEMTDGLISLNLKGVELSSVIRLFSELSGVNIILPEMESGEAVKKVDVNLRDVEWKPALQAILDTSDLELYEKIAGSKVYSIRKKLPAADAPQSTETFVFHHADINMAAEMIKGLVGERGQVFSYPQGNAVVVKASQAVMDDVAQVATRIDQPRRQVLIESRIMELTDSKDRDLGVDWSKEGSGLLKRAVSVSPDLEYALGDIGQIGANNPVTPVTTELTLNAGQLSVLLSALNQVADIKMVSSPKVIVANGETANINILSKVPKLQRTLSQSQAAGGGTLTTVQVEQDEDGMDANTGRKRFVEYEFGIRLAVTPTVYSEENIAVNIVPIISRENAEKTSEVLVGTVDGEKIVDTYYAIDEKRVETTFMLANKQTAVIGGLTETTKEEQQKKVPLLSSIPLLRHLFTYTYTGNVQKENVIFVTVSLEDGKSFDIAKAVKQSPLTRKQLIRDDNQQVVDDRDVELFKQQEEARIQEDITIAERKDQVEQRDRTVRKPFWNILRP